MAVNASGDKNSEITLTVMEGNGDETSNVNVVRGAEDDKTMSSSDGVQKKEQVEKLRRDAREGHWGKVLATYEKERMLRMEKITEKGDTVLHLALSEDADAGFEMVSLLLDEQKEKTVKDDQNIELGAEDAVSHVKEVLRAKNIDGESPIFLAALHGNKRAFLWLHYLCKDEDEGASTGHNHADCIKRNNNDTILHCAIERGHIDVAIEIFHLYEDLVKEMKRNKEGLSPLHLLAATPSAFKSTSLHGRFITVHLLYWLFSVKKKKRATKKEELEHEQIPSDGICTRVIVDFLLGSVCIPLLEIPCVGYIFALLGSIIAVLLALTLAPALFILALVLRAGEWLRKIREMKEEHEWYGQIMDGLLKHASPEQMSRMPDSEARKVKVETPLMIAAKNGVVEMVDKILDKFPGTINDKNVEKKNIVLLAAENRQTKLYQFLLKQKHKNVPKSAFSKLDNTKNTALHLAAMSGANVNWQTTTMIEEFKWFEIVKKSMPPNLREHINASGKSAARIFQESYGELMKGDLEWLNKISQACSVVSGLVASMVFPNVAASSDHQSGKPILRNKIGFKALPNPYLVTLSFSLMSTVTFLGILAYRFQSASFWTHVPIMLYLGMLFMFASLVSLWISLMLHDHSPRSYVILGSPIAVLIMVLLPIFLRPTLKSMFTKPKPPNQTLAKWSRRKQKR